MAARASSLRLCEWYHFVHNFRLLYFASRKLTAAYRHNRRTQLVFVREKCEKKKKKMKQISFLLLASWCSQSVQYQTGRQPTHTHTHARMRAVAPMHILNIGRVCISTFFFSFLFLSISFATHFSSAIRRRLHGACYAHSNTPYIYKIHFYKIWNTHFRISRIWTCVCVCVLAVIVGYIFFFFNLFLSFHEFLTMEFMHTRRRRSATAANAATRLLQPHQKQKSILFYFYFFSFTFYCLDISFSVSAQTLNEKKKKQQTHWLCNEQLEINYISPS